MTERELEGSERRPTTAGARLGRRAAMLGGAAALVATAARAAPVRYTFNQKLGTLEFTAHHLGLLTSTGRFNRFDAEILLDSADASRAAVDVTVDTASIVLAWPGAEDLLRSPAYFDSVKFPTAHFKGSTVGPGGLERFAIKGDLMLRGITRPFDMQGRLLARRFDRALGSDVADFAAGGNLSRSAFGMTADEVMTGDEIRIGVRVAIQLTDPPRDG